MLHESQVGYIYTCYLLKTESEVQSGLKVLYKAGEDRVQRVPCAVYKADAREDLVNKTDTFENHGRWDFSVTFLHEDGGQGGHIAGSSLFKFF